MFKRWLIWTGRTKDLTHGHLLEGCCLREQGIRTKDRMTIVFLATQSQRSSLAPNSLTQHLPASRMHWRCCWRNFSRSFRSTWTRRAKVSAIPSLASAGPQTPAIITTKASQVFEAQQSEPRSCSVYSSDYFVDKNANREDNFVSKDFNRLGLS